MESNNKLTYTAMYQRSVYAGHPLPSFSEVVESVVKANKGLTVKRADIVDAVAQRIFLDADKSISGGVSAELKRLQEENKVVPAKKHGYWVMTP